MEPAAATTTPPPSERHRSPKVKRQRSAAAQPLGDVTNLLLPSTPTNPTTGRPRPLPPTPPPLPPLAPRLPRTLPSPSLLPPPLLRSVAWLNRPSPPCIQGATPPRRGEPTTTHHFLPEHQAALLLQLLQVKKQGTRPISSLVPCHRSKKTKSTRMENTSSGKHMLPEDFVKKQRAYFEEVDAFELPEEEASETDLE
ncbi:hypothetical protein EE612_053158 [Oryza sativa]|nr:hypothetical protein EE612_053158 [Oryza sativa]